MRSTRGRLPLLLVPLSAVGVVLLGVVAGGSRPIRAARVYAGPTQGVSELALRVEVFERDRMLELPVPGESVRAFVLDAGRRAASSSARTDARGSAELSLHLSRPRDSALELWIEPGGRVAAPLAHGLVLGRVDAFRASAGRRGGFQNAARPTDLVLSVAPAHGVLVSAQGGLDDELVVRALRAGTAAVGLDVKLKLEGAEPATAELRTDAQGLARLPVRPSDTSVRVALEAAAPNGERVSQSTRLDVVQGAIRASRRGDRLLLESSGASSLAFVDFFDEERRYTGVVVALSADPRGHLVGETAWPANLAAVPLWAVTSSQADLASPAAVGWPIVTHGEPDPKTFDVRELLLLDGAPAARVREERRARRVRLVTAGYAALALLVTLFLFLRSVRKSERELAEHLAGSGLSATTDGIAPPRRARVVLAAACIGLGFIVLALFALIKE